MVPIKANIFKDDVAYHFAVHEKTVGEDILTSYVAWESYTQTKTADDVQAENAVGGIALAEAKTYLLESLALGPRSPKDLESDVELQGIKRTTLYEAKRKLAGQVQTIPDPEDGRRGYWKLAA